MSERSIPFGRPMLDASEIEKVTQVLSGTQLVHGPVTREFEQKFAERAGAGFALSVASCTAGLHLSLFTKGIGPGDEVIVPAMTHVATAHAVEFCGATPVFADVERDSGNIDSDAVSAAVTEKTKAIIVVHYLGLPCDMERIMAIADAADAFVIEDCALAVDATFDGRKVGNFGATGCYSFYPVKHITTLKGGMVVLNDEDLSKAIAQRKAFGYDRMLGQRSRPGIYDVTVLGYNYRMNEVEAAVGLSQLAKLDEFQSKRALNFNILFESLNEVEELTVFPSRKGKAVSSHYCLNATLPADGSIDRDSIVASLKEAGIGTSVHYPGAVPLMGYYREKYGYSGGEYPAAEWLGQQTISLPVGPHVSEDDAAYIAKTLRNAVKETTVLNRKGGN